MRIPNNKAAIAAGAITAIGVFLGACSQGGDNSDSVTVQGDIPIAYVKRPISDLGNPTDSIMTGSGGDLYTRAKSSPGAAETNLTGGLTLGVGDVSDPEVSFDGTKILFAMHCAAQSAKACTDPDNTGATDTRWRVWEYDTGNKQFRRVLCDAAVPGDDVDPAYLPDGRIVFVSNRQEGTKKLMQAEGITPYTYVDEYEREQVTTLHVMNADGSNCKQISFNQSHDRNPTVLSSGEIMYSRWDHIGERNQFSIFKINPDGTNPFIVYGAHSPGNSYLHPREMADGRVLSTVMPLSRTREGGSLEIIDIAHYSDIDSQNDGGPTPPPNQLGQIAGQFQAAKLLLPNASDAQLQAMRGRDISPFGRYSTPYPLWDGSNRALVVFTPSQPVQELNALGVMETVEGTPQYGIYMLDLDAKTLRPVVPPQAGFYYSDPIPLQSRPVPTAKGNFSPDTSIGAGMGLLDVNTVYDTDRLQNMGNAVLATGESIPQASGRPDIANLKKPGTTAFDNRVARFFRITKAVPTPAGLSREVIGETEFEMQQILGYGVIEPDGSLRAKVPADTPVTITVLDQYGRAFKAHTNWIQAREGERRFCKGCHSSRLSTTNPNGGNFLNDPASVGMHPNGTATTTMAQTRAAADAAYPSMKHDPVFTDFWTGEYNTRDGTSIAPQPAISLTYAGLTTPAPAINGPVSCSTTWSKDCSIVINFPDHIQPILTAKCASCHSGATAAAGIDLSSTIAGATGRVTGYDELLVGDPLLDANGLPIITINPDDGEVMIEREIAPVEAGAARGSRLIERIFGQTLKADASDTSQRAFCRATGQASCVNSATFVDHSAMLNDSEKRLISEWVDIGAQYYNDPFNGTTLRSAAAQLSEDVFGCRVQPILQANCASCHQPFAGNGASTNPPNPNFVANRFILTGNTEADFSVTASMVTDVANPDASLLLVKPSHISTDTPAHPDLPNVTPATAVMPAGSANYNTLREWIAGTLTCP
jgi:Hydrazine synthase alpha subunit middle domain/WD40-like Beta Propeller Repeat